MKNYLAVSMFSNFSCCSAVSFGRLVFVSVSQCDVFIFIASKIANDVHESLWASEISNETGGLLINAMTSLVVFMEKLLY